MKKSTVLATFLIASLCVAPLAGCGNGDDVEIDGEKFVLANYAMELPAAKTLTSYAEYSSAVMKNFRIEAIGSTPSEPYEIARVRGKDANSGKYALYNLKRDSVVSDYYDAVSQLSSSPFYLLRSDETGEYRIASPTGGLIVDRAFDSNSFRTGSSYYYNAKGERITYYYLGYPDNTETGMTQVYCTYDSEAKEWIDLTEEEIEQTQSGYELGDTLGLTKIPLADKTEYPGYTYSDYSYTREGSSYTAQKFTFYRENEELDSVTVYNGSELGVLGHYFYYYKIDAVSSDATTGYNVEIVGSSGSSMKANFTLCRYDFVNGDFDEVDTDYVLGVNGSYTRLYSNTSQDFDMALAQVYKKTDGVAVISEVARSYLLIFDAEMDVSFNLTSKSSSGSTRSLEFYRLSDNRFLMGSSIIDENMNVLVQFPSSSVSVWKEQNLVMFYDSNMSTYYLADFDGKIVVKDISTSGSSPIAFGANLLAYNKDGDRAVFSKSNPTGKLLSDIISHGDDETIGTSYQGLLVKTSGDVQTFYNYSGKEVGSLTGFNRYSSFSYAGRLYYTGTDESGADATLIFK